MNRERQLQNFLSFPDFCSYFTFKTELCYKTHIDWHNSVTSVRPWEIGPSSGHSNFLGGIADTSYLIASQYVYTSDIGLEIGPFKTGLDPLTAVHTLADS